MRKPDILTSKLKGRFLLVCDNILFQTILNLIIHSNNLLCVNLLRDKKDHRTLIKLLIGAEENSWSRISCDSCHSNLAIQWVLSNRNRFASSLKLKSISTRGNSQCQWVWIFQMPIWDLKCWKVFQTLPAQHIHTNGTWPRHI